MDKNNEMLLIGKYLEESDDRENGQVDTMVSLADKWQERCDSLIEYHLKKEKERAEINDYTEAMRHRTSASALENLNISVSQG